MVPYFMLDQRAWARGCACPYLKRTVSPAQQCDSIGVKLEKFVNFFKRAEFVQKELFF